MRVEHIAIPKSIPESPHRQGMAQGDIVVAEVTDIKGDQVFLKNQDGGGELTAKLLSDIPVAVGDYVETVVDEASGGRYVLRVIDISRQMPFAAEGLDMTGVENQSARAHALLNTLAMMKNNPGADPKAAAFLSRHGLAGTAENLETLSQMAKGMSPVAAVLAEVMKSFGAMKEPKATMGQMPQPVPNANPAPLTQTGQSVTNAGTIVQSAESAEGQTTGAVMPQTTGQVTVDTVNGNMAQASETMQAETTQMTEGLQPPAETQTILPSAGQQSTGAAGQSVGQTLASGAEPAAANSAQPQVQATSPSAAQIQNADGQTVPTDQANQQTVYQSSEAVSSSASAAEQSAAVPHMDRPNMTAETGNPVAAVETEGTLDTAQSIKTPAKGETVKSADIPDQHHIAEMTKEMPRHEQIMDKALAMFAPLEDADELAAHIKKAVQELPEQLKELKVLIEHADSTVKETVTAKFDQIEKQMLMMNEVKRFDCYQIPVQISQQQTAAELYVYRYRGGKKTVDPENILILLGLDTQYMGRVETLIKTNGKSLNIEFNLEDMRLGDEMKIDAVSLEQAAKESGYNLAGISVKQLAARTTVLNAENRLEKEAGVSAGNVDVRI